MKKIAFKTFSSMTAALIVSLTSCTSRNTPVDSSKMEREPIDYEVITDSLYTSGVGSFVYTGRYVVWTDIVQPFNAFEGNFIHVVDPELKKEVASMGRKGNGPNEFNTPVMERYNGDTIYVRDLNVPKQALFSLTDAAEGKNSIIPLASQEIAFEDKLLITKESQVRCNPSYKDTPLRYINGTDTIPFGQYAVNPDVDDDMVRENLLQMAIEYYANLEILICEAAYYPYVALYKKAGNSFELMTEVKGEIDYTISDGWIKFSRDGFFTCKLTKNYLVTLDFDIMVI